MKEEKDPLGKSAKEPGAKLDAGKVRPSLVIHSMPRAMLAISEVSTYGAEKYSEEGWLHVPNGEKRYSDAMLRHLLEEGKEEFDVSGLRHAAQVAWNAMARLELMLRRLERPLASSSTLAVASEELRPGDAVILDEQGRARKP